MIFILTAPVQSGKTTSLVKWAEKRNDVYGIVTPVVDGKRVFSDIATKEEFPMEAVEGEETLLVGRFIFSKTGFEKAVSIIRDAIDKNGWLIIDEIGPLELRGEGFHDIVRKVLRERKEKIILVVREGLVQQVKDHFMIKATAIDNIDTI